MRANKLPIILTIVCFSLNMAAQNIRYAADVLDFSSQWNSPAWGAVQTLNVPDTYPYYGDYQTAWASLTANTHREFLVLLFDDPQPVDRIDIYETYNPGAVDSLYLRNAATGVWEQVWSDTAAHAGNQARIFSVDITPTAYSVDAIRIALNSPAVAGWNEIDAVALINSDGVSADSTLLAYFPFNGNANDESGNGNHGTVHGAELSDDRFGRDNKAYRFTNPDYIKLDGGTTGVYPFTVSLWFQSEPTADAGTIFSFREDPQDYDYYVIRTLASGKVEFFYTNGPASNGQVISARNFTDNRWHHIVAVQDGPRTGKLYIDNRLEGIDDDNSGPWGVIDTTHSIAVGRNEVGNSDYFTGKIDDIRTYARVLSEAEIDALFREGGWGYRPLAADDAVSTARNEAVSVPVLANDFHPGNSPMSVSEVFPAIFGSVSIDPGDSTVTYIPFSEFSGPDQFAYAVSDTFGGLDTAAVYVTVFDFPPVDSGLVAYYPFSGNADDASGNGNDGTVLGPTLTNDAFGNPNRAYSFDGSNDYIRIDNSATIYDISSEFTFAAWIYPQALFGNEWVVVMTKGNIPANSPYAILYRAQGGDIIPYLRFLGSGGQSVSLPLTGATGALSLNEWNFITWRFSAGLVEIFRDGSEIGEYDTGIPTLAQNTLPVDLGRDLPGAIEYYNGVMDEVYLYNRALSDDEIQAIYSYTLQEIRLAIANDDLGTTTLNTPITLNVLRNDFHSQNAPLSIAGFTQPFQGSVIQTGDSTLRYIPSAGFSGNDGFEYIIRDPEDNRDTASVGITVTPAQADLTVSAVEIPAAVFSGQNFAVRWTVTNLGSQGTNVPEWFDRVYLSESPLFVPQQAVLLGEFPNFSFLLPGEGYQTERSFIMPQGREGAHYIFVQTDARGQLPEIDETNNRRRSPTPIAVSLPDLPDLQVSAVTLQPAQPNAGGSVTLQWTVTNLGNGVTVPGQWFDTAFFSRDSVLNFFFPVSPPNTIVYTDPEAGKAARSGALNPQESYATSIPFTLPHDIESGDTVYFFVHADYDAPTPGGKGAERGAVYEHTADYNNITRLAVPVLGTPPDLEVTDISGYPTAASVAESVPISFTVANNGLGDTYETNWIDRVYISPGSVFDPDSAIAVGTFGHTGALARFASYTVSNTVTLPGSRSGEYYFHVITDLNNDVFEGSGQEGNNQAAGSAPIDIRHPDLAVSGVTAPATATTGETVSLSWTVENAGSGTAFQRPWADRVYLSRTPQFNPDSAAVLGSFSHNQPLAPGSSYSGQGTVQIPPGFSGGNWIFVASDWQNAVYEDSANANNRRRATGSTAILYPDLEVTEVMVPDTGSSGNSFAVQWSVRNNGSGAVLGSSWRDDLYISRLPVFDPDSALLLGSKPRSFELPPDSVYVATAAVTLPNGIQGDYYLFAVADGGNTIFEHDQEGNNRLRSSGAAQIQLSPWADLIVTGVEIPDSANVGEQLRLSYTVQNAGAVQTRSSAWSDRIYVSAHPAWDSSATLLRTLPHDGRLAVGANYTETTLLFLNSGFAGARYFHVISNADGAEYEHPPANANNSGSSDSLQIGAYPPVDLAAALLAAPDSAASGATVTLRWRVANLGLASTLSPNWRDGAYLSPDTLLDPAVDIRIGIFPHTGTLAPGQNYVQNRSITLPQGIAGDYYLIIRPDIDGNINDSNPGNDLAITASPIPISLSPPVDLAPLALNAPGSGIAGQPLETISEVINHGPGSIQNRQWNDAMYLSADAAISPDDRFLGFVTRSHSLASQGLYRDTVFYDLPNYISGNYYLLFKTDSQDRVYEHQAEGNNLLSLPMFVTLPPPADLIVSGITVPDSALSGDSVTFSWTIRNIGDNPATGWLTDAVYVSSDTAWQVGDPLAGTDYRYIDLAPGAAQQRSLRVRLSEVVQADSLGNLLNPLPGVVPGNYVAIVRTDIRNNIREYNLANNRRASADSLTVEVDRLVLGVADTASIREGQMLYYRVDVGENLDLRITLNGDSLHAANEIYVAYNRVPTLTDYDFVGNVPFSGIQKIMISSTSSGSYYLLISNKFAMMLENEYIIKAESLSFSISSLNPQFGGNTGQVTLEIIGAKFENMITAYLRNAVTTLPAINIQYNSSNKIFATFDLAGSNTGYYDILLINPGDDSLKIEQGFEIVTGLATSLSTDLLYPPAVRPNQIFPITIYYENTGNVDIPYPTSAIMSLGGASIAYTNNQLDWGFHTLHLEYLEADGPALILRPGASGNITIYAKANSDLRFEVVKYTQSMPAFSQLSLLTGNNCGQNNCPVQWFKGTCSCVPDLIFTEPCQNHDNCYGTCGSDRAACDIKFFDDMMKAGFTKYLLGGYLFAPIALTYFSGVRLMGKCFWQQAQEDVCPGISPPPPIPVPKPPYDPPTDYDRLPGSMLLEPEIIASIDPNDITGPAGFGDEHWVSRSQTLPYTIRFENDSTLATAPALAVNITQALDSTVDARSFRLGSFGFGDFIFTPPANSAYYSERLDVVDSLGVFVDVTAGINLNAGTIFWNFTSIDPVTGQAPTSPFAGFLPVNDASGRGEGFVSYTVKPDPAARSGDVINAAAEIVFDVNEPIVTEPIFHTIDAGAPLSAVDSLPAQIVTPSFEVNWSGQDDSPGSGLRRYDVYVARDSSAFELWLSDTTVTAEIYRGELGHTYRFYSIAEDYTGNLEALDPAAIITTRVDTGAVGIKDEIALPKAFALHQNYPNPFNPSTTIRYDLPRVSRVKLVIYNVLGQKVRTLVNERQEPGFKAVLWDGRGDGGMPLASGVYFYRMQAEQFVKVRKLLLLK